MSKLWVPDRKRLSAVQCLCEYSHPYDYGINEEELFVNAMRENIKWHIDKCSFYKKLCGQRKFCPDSLQSIHDCYTVPFIHANFFKTHEVLSIKKSEVFLHLTSSGTTGQKSQIFFDEWSIRAAQRMVDYILRMLLSEFRI